jgi:phospholipid transport system substrate-binding protein
MEKLFATLFLVAAATASNASPRDVVQNAVARVVAIVGESSDAERTAKADVVDRRRAEVRRLASEIFDFDEMARRALSRHWAPRTKVEQTEFVELFTDLLERTYVARIESYAGERISYPTEIIDGEYATVRSRIVTRRRAETLLDYRLHLVDGKRWKVFDISVDGVSFVATYRSEFSRIVQSSSYAALVDRMRKKRLEIDALARKADRPDAAVRSDTPIRR